MQVEKQTPTPVINRGPAPHPPLTASSPAPAPRPPMVTPKPAAPVARSARSGEFVRGLTMPRSAFVGFCLTAFACGVVTTVAVDRVWPRRGDDAPVVLQSAVQPARVADVPATRPPSPEVQEIHSAAIAIEPSPEARSQGSRIAVGLSTSPPARKRPAAAAERAPFAETPSDPPLAPKWHDPFE